MLFGHARGTSPSLYLPESLVACVKAMSPFVQLLLLMSLLQRIEGKEWYVNEKITKYVKFYFVFLFNNNYNKCSTA